MKLWQKTSLICIVVLLVVVLTCSTVLLIHSKNRILDMTYKQAEVKQHNLFSSFYAMTNYYLAETDSNAVRNTLINYCFSQFADASSVLVRGQEPLITGVTINPADYLPLDDDINAAETYTGEINGRNILIVGSRVQIGGEQLSVYVVEDISTVYNSIADMVWVFVAVSGIGILLGIGFIILLMRRSTRPLTTLAGVARRIADGDYEMRADVYATDEIGYLSTDFNKMAEAVETHVTQLTETAERQRLFVGGVTHEFKTPLTTLLLHARMLRRANMTDEEKDHSLEHIETQCEWLERLTQKLLKLITLNESVELKPQSVHQLFDMVCKNYEHLNINCRVDTLNIDSDLMCSALINLCDNAFKAGASEVSLLAYDNIIEVTDNGQGIPSNEIDRVFEPFYMIDKSRSKKSGGSGLGLALVKQIADAHGVELEIESAIGSGTTVKLIFEITN